MGSWKSRKNMDSGEDSWKYGHNGQSWREMKIKTMWKIDGIKDRIDYVGERND